MDKGAKLIARFLLCVCFAVCFLSGQAFSFDNTIPTELQRLVPEAAELVNENASDVFGLVDGVARIMKRSAAEIRKYLFSGARAVAVIMIGVVLLGVVESLSDDSRVMKYTTLVGALWVTSVSAGDMTALIGLGQETISALSVLSKCLIPVLAASTAAAGSVTTASVRQAGTVLFSDILLSVIEKFLLPLLYLYIGLSAAACVLDGGAMERIGTLLKKVITWCLSGLLVLFTTYLSLGGAIAGSVDAQALHMTKAAIGTVVPVVGGVLAEAAESLVAGAGILRGMTGIFGVLAVLSLCLVPFLRLGLQYLLYQAAGFVAQTAGPGKLTKLLFMMGDAFSLILAMTAACALVLIISIVSTLTVVTV